jgi:phosphate starvation-inducible PhoH-like protein
MNFRLYSFAIGACMGRGLYALCQHRSLIMRSTHNSRSGKRATRNVSLLTTNSRGDRRSPEEFGKGQKAYSLLTQKVAKLPEEFGRESNIFSKITEKSIQITKSSVKNYVPRGKLQKHYVDFLADPDVSVVFGTGPAGCGKTLFACIAAIQGLKQGTISRIIFTRPLVTVEEDMGFLPGNIMKKMDPWLQPLYDIFLEHYTRKELDLMIANNIIEISPLGFMRGRTFKNAFIIADEMQNSSPNQILMLLTRIGSGSKMVITGDLQQSDLQHKSSMKVNNGLYDFIHKMKLYSYKYILEEIRLVEMTSDDVERSPVVRRVLEISNFYEKQPDDIL